MHVGCTLPQTMPLATITMKTQMNGSPISLHARLSFSYGHGAPLCIYVHPLLVRPAFICVGVLTFICHVRVHFMSGFLDCVCYIGGYNKEFVMLYRVSELYILTSTWVPLYFSTQK